MSIDPQQRSEQKLQTLREGLTALQQTRPDFFQMAFLAVLIGIPVVVFVEGIDALGRGLYMPAALGVLLGSWMPRAGLTPESPAYWKVIALVCFVALGVMGWFSGGVLS